MRIIFKTDPDLSFFHAASVVGGGFTTIDDKLTSAIESPVQRIRERLEIADLNTFRFWQSLVANANADDTKRVESSLLHAGCSELTVDSLTPAVVGQLTDARLAFRSRYPKLAEQLPLRAGPLRELWDATGPGLLKLIGRRTITTIIPSKATILLLQPIRGGDGGLVDRNDTVWLEAVLTNPDARIPETLRLAWLIARKGVEKVESNRWVAPERLSIVASLALIPFVLSAGEELELCRAGEAEIERAVELWHADEAPTSESRISTSASLALIKWWSQMLKGELPLPVAFKALDKMLD